MKDLLDNFNLADGKCRDYSKFDLVTTETGDLSIKDADVFWDELERAVDARDMDTVIRALSLFDILLNLPKDLNR